jgi:hypothetical protein
VADSRIQWLFGVAAALAVARFMVVPWVQAQNEQRQQLEVLTQRLDRSEGVLQNREAVLTARDLLAKDAESGFSAFPLAAGDDESRLAGQRRVTAMATEAGLQVTLFDWVLDGSAEEPDLAYARASVKMAGPLDRLILLHGDLEGQLPFAVLRKFELKPRSPARGPDSDPASALMVIDFYYRPARTDASLPGVTP